MAGKMLKQPELDETLNFNDLGANLTTPLKKLDHTHST